MNKQRSMLCVLAAIAAVAWSSTAWADEWTAEDFGSDAEWRRRLSPEATARLYETAIRRFDSGDIGSDVIKDVVDSVKKSAELRQLRAMGKRDASEAQRGMPVEQNIDAYVESVLRKKLAPVAARADRDQRVEEALEALDRQIRMSGARILSEKTVQDGERTRGGLFQQARALGLSLRRVAGQPAGFKDPATIAYQRDLKTDDEALTVEFGLTYRPKARTALFGGRTPDTVRGLLAPVFWVSANLTTAEPTSENFWGGGMAAELNLGNCSVCRKPCCGDMRLKLSGGLTWHQSQDEDTQKVTGFIEASPFVGNLSLGLRRPIAGSYESSPISFVWNTSARFDYGHTVETGATRETSEDFLRGTFKATATFYFDQLGRWLRRDCDVKGDICNPDARRMHDPYFQAEWNGFWLTDESLFVNWTRLSLVVPIPGDEGFTFSFVYENGAQAPVSFQDTESIGLKFGVRF